MQTATSKKNDTSAYQNRHIKCCSKRLMTAQIAKNHIKVDNKGSKPGHRCIHATAI